MHFKTDDKSFFKLFIILATGLLVAEYPEVVFSDFTFFFRDFGIFSYPNAFYNRHCFLNAEIPFWNPLNEFGIPFLAQWNTMTLYPGNFLFIIFPIQWSLGIFNLLHLVFGGIGMFFLVKRIFKNEYSAALAGIGYEFNGITLNSLMWCNNIAALGLMPWTVLVVHRALQEKSLKSLSLAVILCSIQILTGAPEIIAFTWIVIAGICISEFLNNKTNSMKLLLIPAIIFIGAILLTLVQLLPFYQLVLNSHRVVTGGDSSWSLRSPINLIAPLVNTFQWNYGIVFQKGQYWASSTYINVGIIWLAVLGAIFGNGWLRLIAIFFSLSGILLAMGDNSFLLPIGEKFIGILAMIRFPVKFVVLTLFFIPFLAAFGFGHIQNLDLKREKGKFLVSILIAVLLFFLISFFTIKDLDNIELSLSNREFIIKNIVFRGLFLFGFLLLVFVNKFYSKLGQASILALIFIIFLDVKTHLPRQNPTVENWVFNSDLFYDERPHGFNLGRILTRHDKDYLESRIVKNNPAMEILSKRLGLYSNLNLLEGVSKATGMFSLHISTTAAILSRIYENGVFIPEGLADFLSIHWLTDTNTQFQWIERKSFLPLVISGQKVIYTDDLTAWNNIFSPEFAPQQVAYLPIQIEKKLGKIEHAKSQVDSIRIKPHLIEFNIVSDKPCIVTIGQAFYPCWKAKIDGKRTEVIKANYGFQSLIVPSGVHKVRVYYYDLFFMVGFLVSFSATIGIFLILKINYFKNWQI